MTYVLDASALLYVLFDEPGADYVAERLSEALVSATNYTEVVSKLVERGAPAKEIVVIMADLDIEVIAVDRHQAELAGLVRTQPGTSASRSAIAVTTDRAWRDTDFELYIVFAQ